MHLHSHTAYRVAVGLALTAAFLIVWLNAAAGLIGIKDDDPANLLYVGVLAIGLIGAMSLASASRLGARGVRDGARDGGGRRDRSHVAQHRQLRADRTVAWNVRRNACRRGVAVSSCRA